MQVRGWFVVALLAVLVVVAFAIASFGVRDEAVSVARRYALAQRAGEAELGVVLSLRDPVSTGTEGNSTCVVFAADAPLQARVGVLVRRVPSGWEPWFSRASKGNDLDCDGMLREARLLNTNLIPYVK